MKKDANRRVDGDRDHRAPRARGHLPAGSEEAIGAETDVPALHHLKNNLGRFEDVILIENYVIQYGEDHESLGTTQDQMKEWYAKFDVKVSDLTRT